MKLTSSCSLLLFLFLITRTSNTYAQGIPVIDIAHIAVTVANGATLDDQLEKILINEIKDEVSKAFKC